MKIKTMQFEKAFKKFKGTRHLSMNPPFWIARLRWVETVSRNDPYYGVTIVTYDENNRLEWGKYDETLCFMGEQWKPTPEDLLASDWVVIPLNKRL